MVHNPIIFEGESLLVDIPRSVAEAAGMLSQGERRLLYGLASRFEGKGKIIDGGSFLGASTVSLASGLNDAEPGVIHAYEIGHLPSKSKLKIERKFGSTVYVMGESFVPILENAIAPWKDLVTLHIGDLLEEKWTGDPIEICFIDVCKTPALNAHVSKIFYPYIIEGGYLINQDYYFDRLPYVKSTMGYLDEYFEWVGRVYTTSIWRCVKQVPRDVADYDPFLARDNRCLAWHEMANDERLDDEARFRLAVSQVYLRAYMHGSADEDLLAIESEYDDYIEVSARLWNGKEGPRRDAQFRIDRARRSIAMGTI